MTTQTIVLTAGIIFVFGAIIGGGFKLKDIEIPRLPGGVRIVLAILGLFMCLPFVAQLLRNITGSVPVGTIMAYNGNPAHLEGTGWVLCDKTHSEAYPGVVPNLESRFIVGVGATNSLGSTGGTAEVLPGGRHTHSASTHGLPLHREWRGEGHNQDSNRNRTHDHEISVGEAGEHSHGDNRPPFYALFFIIRIR